MATYNPQKRLAGRIENRSQFHRVVGLSVVSGGATSKSSHGLAITIETKLQTTLAHSACLSSSTTTA